MRAESRVSASPTAAAAATRRVPLIAHIIYRLDVGGLENGLVNLINRIPEDRFRHAIVCLTGYTHFRRRILRDDVAIYSLSKPAGNSPAMHFRLWRLLKALRPDIVHTRNLAALETTFAAALAGVRVRIHSEHGRDVDDLDGTSRKHQAVRRLFKPFVHQYVALSRDLERYLQEQVRVPPEKVAQIYNGVDTDLFCPPRSGRDALPHADFVQSNVFVIGTVGRMEAVKDQLTLARAFVILLRMVPADGRALRLVIVGDGAQREVVERFLEEAGVRHLAWLPGARDDVAELMRGLDLFVLPSLAEGVSNTILEAMATGLPVVATDVGGNAELVRDGRTGQLVPRADPQSLAQAIYAHYSDAAECRRRGREARVIAERCFSMSAMVSAYVELYDRLLNRRTQERARSCAAS